MSQFVFLFRASHEQQDAAMGTAERAQESMQRWMTWVRGLEANGNLASPGQPLALDGRVVRGGPNTVVDGPYTEAKDLVLGFMVIEARDMDHAVDIARTCPMVLGGAAVEVRPVGSMGA